MRQVWRRCSHEQRRFGLRGILTNDQSLSAALIVEGATYYSLPNNDGTFQIVYDMETYEVVIPLVYDMDARVADIEV